MREFLSTRKGKVSISIVALAIIVIFVVLLVDKCGKEDDKAGDYVPQNGESQDIESVIIEDNDSYENEDNGGMHIVDSEDGPTNNKESTSFSDVSEEDEDSSEDSNVSDNDNNQGKDDEQKDDETSSGSSEEDEKDNNTDQSTTDEKWSVLF